MRRISVTFLNLHTHQDKLHESRLEKLQAAGENQLNIMMEGEEKVLKSENMKCSFIDPFHTTSNITGCVINCFRLILFRMAKLNAEHF